MLIKSKVSRFIFHHQTPTNLHSIRTFLDNIEIQFVRDRALDHVVEREKDLKFVVNLKNLLKKEPSKSLPLSSIVDNAEKLRIPCRAIEFIRKYPFLFEEYFPGNVGVHPHVRLTPEIIHLDSEEEIVFSNDEFRKNAADRLLKLLMLCRVNEIDLKLIDRFKWDLGLPDDYVDTLVNEFPDYFRLKNVRSKGVGGMLELVCWDDEMAVSVAERRAMKETDGYQKGMPIAFPLQYSKGFEMDKKLKKWVDEWQKLPYVSPYENAMQYSPTSDMSDRWVVAVLHELLHILVPMKTERENLLCFGEYLGIKPRIKRAIAHHPGIFYRSSKNGTHTVVLRDGYKRGLLIDNHPLMDMRSKYIHLMHKVKEVKKTVSVPSPKSGKQQLVKEGLTEKEEANGEGPEEESQVSDPDVDESTDEDYDDDEEEEEEGKEEQVESSRAQRKSGRGGSGEVNKSRRKAKEGRGTVQGEIDDDDSDDDEEEEEEVKSSRGGHKDGRRGYAGVNDGRRSDGRGRPVRNASRYERGGDDEDKRGGGSRGGHDNGRRGFSKANEGRTRPGESRGRPGRIASRYEGGDYVGKERFERSRGGGNNERRGFSKVNEGRRKPGEGRGRTGGDASWVEYDGYGDKERIERSMGGDKNERRGFSKVNEGKRKSREGRGKTGGNASRHEGGDYGDKERVERSRGGGSNERRGFSKVNEGRGKPGEGRVRTGGNASRYQGGDYGDKDRVERSRGGGNNVRRGFGKAIEGRRKPGEGTRPGRNASRERSTEKQSMR